MQNQKKTTFLMVVSSLLHRIRKFNKFAKFFFLFVHLSHPPNPIFSLMYTRAMAVYIDAFCFAFVLNFLLHQFRHTMQIFDQTLYRTHWRNTCFCLRFPNYSCIPKDRYRQRYQIAIKLIAKPRIAT